MALSKEVKDYYKSFAQHGVGDNLVQLEPREITLLIYISYNDIYNKYPIPSDEIFLKTAKIPYYFLKEKDIEGLPDISIDDTIKYFELTDAFKVSEYTMYLHKLCDLHRKRFKYRIILRNQPFPTVEQIGPRSLLEYGNCESNLLFNWMSWRKWAYDIDNRSAQETGYLFEPILVSCIGGETISHSKSPVKRLDDKGKKTSEGRQIDCFIQHGKNKYAYELKMRVTIAASGQGRFNEEMTFPKEAKTAGIIPVLVVFDSTESSLLTKLKNEYLENGGEVYIGETAWKHLKDEAGKSMGHFIEKYIEPPIKNMEKSNISIPYPIKLEATEDKIVISDSATTRYEIRRK